MNNKELERQIKVSFEKLPTEPIKKREELSLYITLKNNSGKTLEFHPLWSKNPSLVLEVKDEKGNQVLLPPPPVPSPRDMELASLALKPSESLSLSIPPFFDMAQPAGKYSIRYVYKASVAGTDEKYEIASDWIEIVLDKPAIPPPPLPGVSAGIFGGISGLLSSLYCLIKRVICAIFPKPCDKKKSIEVNEAISETMSGATPGNEAWNGNYGWNSRFTLSLDQANCKFTVTVKIKINGAITDAQKTAWKNAIEAKFNNIFKLCCKECCGTCCPNGYSIGVIVQFVDSGQHQTVNIQPTTTNMSNWSATDIVAITHEFGHMLGAKDEYFTVDGTAWGNPWQAGAGIMNNPSENPLARHFELVKEKARGLIGKGTKCAIKPAAQNC